MDSKVGLFIQLSGVSLITLLTLFLRRSINVVTLKHWTNAWLFLSFALFCLRLAFSYQEYSTQLFSFYFLTEYMFGFLLVAGCRSLAGNNDMKLGHEFFVLPFIVVAFAMPFLSDDLNLVLNIHSLIMAGFFAIALVSLWRSRPRTFGWRVMFVSLVLLTLDFVQYFALFALRNYVTITNELLAYNPVIDFVLQIMLGFGMVIILLERVLTDAKVANEKLTRAHERLEELAHVDPLTMALNRHAFYGYLKQKDDGGKPITGCVGFFDIDDLKAVNDVHGHAVGDIVIRNVVRAIREIIRAEDLIFRWGGDEFFVIMISLDSKMADERMARLDHMLADLTVEGVSESLSVRVSYAFENFDDLMDLEGTLKSADAGMYRQKQLRKGMADGAYVIDASIIENEVLTAR
ncbi:MAG: GGDEF domain-containing protein [Pyrinomonadaceae bacterium]